MFETQSIKLLGGSLNLSLPGDLVQPGDAVCVRNFRVDQDGVVRARKREAAVGSYPAPLGPVRSLFLQQQPSSGGQRRFWNDANSVYVESTALAPTGADAPVWFASYQGYCWMMSQQLQGKCSISSSVFQKWVPAAPVTPPTLTLSGAAGTGLLAGAYTYFITFVTADGFESNQSPLPVSVSPALQKIALSGIPVSTDPAVTARWIYRSGGTQDQAYRVAVLSDNSTTIYTDNLSDLAAAGLGITHSGNHDAPPAAAGVAGPYYDRLLAWSTAANVNRLFWTTTLQPGYWPGARLTTGNWVDVGDDGEAIVAVSVKPNMVLIYKQRSIWRLTGDPGSVSGDLERIHSNVGLVGPKAWCSLGGFDLLQGAEGIYTCNGDSCAKVSRPLDPVFKADFFGWQPGLSPVQGANYLSAAQARTAMAVRNGRVYISYCDATVGAPYLPNATLVYEPETNRWTEDTRGFTALHDEGNVGYLTGALSGGTGFVDVEGIYNAPLAVQWVSHTLEAGRPRNAKVWADLEIESDLQGDNLLVQALYDFGATGESIGRLQSTGRTAQTFSFPLDRESKNMSVLVTGTLNNQGILYSMHLRYRMEPRDALTFDTGPISLFQGHWGQAAEIETQIKTMGDVTWTLYSDAFGQLAPVATGTIAHGGLTGRRGLQIPLPALEVGRVFRIVLGASSATAPFRLYGMRVFTRRVGLYLVAGSQFQSRLQSCGTNQQKLFKKFEIEGEGLGNFAATVTTVRNGISTGTAGTLSPRGARIWTEIRLPANSRGQQYQLTGSADGAIAIYQARMWFKPLGDAAPSAWQFETLPIEPTPELFTWQEIPTGE